MSKSSGKGVIIDALLIHLVNQNTLFLETVKKITVDDPELQEQAQNVYNQFFNIQNVEEITAMKEETHGDRYSAGRDMIGVKSTGPIQAYSSGTITITNQQLKKIPDEFAEALKEFSEKINEKLKENNIPPEKVGSIQEDLSELAKESEDIDPEKEPSSRKKRNIIRKIEDLADGLLRLLPQTAETLATFTPLAPFNKIIGKGVEEIVKVIQK